MVSGLDSTEQLSRSKKGVKLTTIELFVGPGCNLMKLVAGRPRIRAGPALLPALPVAALQIEKIPVRC